MADDPRDRAANEPVHYDDEPWQGDDTQLAFFADPGDSADADETPDEEPTDGTVQLSVRDILAKREAGEPLDLPERALSPDPTSPAPESASSTPSSGDSLAAAFAAAADDPGTDDPDATAFYDWTIEDFDDEPSPDHESADPAEPDPEPEPDADPRPIAPEVVPPAAIVPGAPLLGVVPDLHPDDEDEPDPQDDADGAPAARRSLGRFPVEGDEPEEPWAPMPAGPATVSVVPDPDDEDDSDSFDSADEYAPAADGDGDPEDADEPAEDEFADADEAGDDLEDEDDAEATVVVPLPQEVAPDDDLLPDEPAPDESDAVAVEADLADDDEPYVEADADPDDEPETGDDAALATDSWGPNPPGTQEEQYWHDDDGLRWRSRDGGYIWFADDGQIWDAQNGEVLRDALTASPAVAAAALTAPEPEPEEAPEAEGADAPPDPAADPGATAAMARTEEPPPTVTTPAAAEARRTREPAATGSSRRTPDEEIPEYVEYAPSGTRRRILTALWLAASVLAVVTIVWAVTSGSQSARGVAITVTGLALGSWWLLLSWAPTTVALAGSSLRVSKGRETEEFDLHDPDLDIRLGDDVDSRSWKAVVTRPDGSELEIPAASVHPDEFVRVVQHHRRRM